MKDGVGGQRGSFSLSGRLAPGAFSAKASMLGRAGRKLLLFLFLREIRNKNITLRPRYAGRMRKGRVWRVAKDSGKLKVRRLQRS